MCKTNGLPGLVISFEMPSNRPVTRTSWKGKSGRLHTLVVSLMCRIYTGKSVSTEPSAFIIAGGVQRKVSRMKIGGENEDEKNKQIKKLKLSIYVQ